MWKQKVLDHYLHLTQYMMKRKVLDQLLYLTHQMLPQKFKMAIYIKTTISKLENSRNMLEIVFLCRPTLNMLNFKGLALTATEM